MLQSLLKQKVHHFFGIAGVVFVLLSMFSVQDITKLQVAFIGTVRLAPFLTGIGFIVLSFVWSFIVTATFPWTAVAKVNRTSQGFQTNIAHASMEVRFGRLEEVYRDTPEALVALPANDDLIDEKCMRDTRTALGAFVNHLFPDRVDEICRLARELLSTQQITADQALSSPPRYQIGTTLYLDKPLAKDVRLAFLSVTNVTDHEGIRCEAPSIFTAIKGLHRLMNSQRLEAVTLPVIGSGHGALPPPVSLLCMLIAFAETLREPSGRHIKRVRIVIYQKDKRAAPVIPYWQARNLLGFVQRYC